MIRGVIFDLDGVITDTAKFHYIAWKKLAENLGIDLTLEFNENLKGISRMESLDKILELKSKKKEFSIVEKENLANSKNEYYKKLIEEISPNDILKGILDFLNELKEKNYKIALASASKNAVFILEKLKIKEKFDYIVDVSKIHKNKPEPDIFIQACKGLNLETNEVVGIEDSQAGIEALKKAKIFSIGINVDADIYLKSSEELNIKIIEKLN